MTVKELIDILKNYENYTIKQWIDGECVDFELKELTIRYDIEQIELVLYESC